MNTFYFPRRNDLYLAMPAERIQARLKEARQSEKTNSTEAGRKESLRAACHSFMSELDSALADVDHLNRVISDELTIDRGLGALLWVKKQRQFSYNDMAFIVGWDPYEAVRLAVVFQMQEGVKELGGLNYQERCEGINPADDLMASNAQVRIMLRFKKARVETAWHFDHGAWRLVYMKPRIDAKDKATSTSKTLEAIFGPRCAPCKPCPSGTKAVPPDGADENKCECKCEPEKKCEPDAEPPKPDDKKPEGNCKCVEDEEKAESRCDCEPEKKDEPAPKSDGKN